jgi:hypothetical protein
MPAAKGKMPVLTVAALIAEVLVVFVVVVTSPVMAPVRAFAVWTASAVFFSLLHDLRYRSRYIVCQVISKSNPKPV